MISSEEIAVVLPCQEIQQYQIWFRRTRKYGGFPAQKLHRLLAPGGYADAAHPGAFGQSRLSQTGVLCVAVYEQHLDGTA